MMGVRTGEGRLRPWRRWLGAGGGEGGAGQVYEVRARDGVRLSVTRYRPASGSGPAVMLVHGLASNRHTLDFDLGPVAGAPRSLARYLAARGFDSFVVELRGSGRSECPAQGWDFGHHLTEDLAALVSWVLETTGREQLHWVGHSMGGLLLFCYGIQFGCEQLASGVTVASALDYRTGATGFRSLLRLRPVLERLPSVPYGALVHAVSPVVGRRVGTPLESFNVVRENIEPWASRRLHANNFGTIPSALLTSLATTFESRGLRDRAGTLFYWEEAAAFCAPVLMLAGHGDRQVSVPAVEATAGRLGGEVSVERFGRAAGHACDYGHFDLLLGRRATSEVWPRIAQWLESHGGEE